MKRRTFLQSLAAVSTLPLLVSCRRASEWLRRRAAAQSTRRLRPSDASWPGAESWEELKEQVGGHLIRVSSPLAPCTKAPGSPDCVARIEEMQNPYFIAEQAGGTQTSGWLDAWTSTPSVYAVEAASTEDVVAAVNFARENNLRLVVKGGGHSYQGTSCAADSLLVWTRRMDAVLLHDAFVPEGTADTPRHAVTIESGARWFPTYNAVTTRGGRYVQGGGCATVGVAGLIQSGGFGSFSKQYGMAAGSLLQAEVVTADGSVLIANAGNHPDLFWALKGGGGGTFGVVTKVTLATHELPEFFGTVQGVIQARSDAAFRKLVGAFLRFYGETLLNPHWGESVAFRSDNTLVLHMVFQGLDQSQAEATWKPFLDFLADGRREYDLGAAPPRIVAIPARRYWDPEYRKQVLPETLLHDNRPEASANNVWFSGQQAEENVFLFGYESLWLPAPLLKRVDALAQVLFSSSRHFEVQLHFNKGLAGAPEDKVAAARDTPMNPAVLDAFALAIIAGGAPHTSLGLPGHEPDLAAGHRVAAAVTAAANGLRTMVPHAGAYVSESNFFDDDWQTSFWGPHYPRLAQVKQKYDAAGLFIVHHGVGSEEWSDDGFTRLPVRQSP
ncbi:MAG: FAD-binding protein [Myxococcaceae bacterium]